MIRADRLVVAVLIAGAVTGCARLGLSEGSRASSPAPTTFEPLPATPTTPVTQGALQPLPPVAGQPPVDPNAPPVAAVPPPMAPVPPSVAAPTPDKAPNVGRTELLGGWRLASGGDNCQLFMNLTSWAGGYRAISKGCASAELQKISAWDLQGKQVTLKGSDGSTVATLVGAGGERFSGSTAGRQPISLSR